MPISPTPPRHDTPLLGTENFVNPKRDKEADQARKAAAGRASNKTKAAAFLGVFEEDLDDYSSQDLANLASSWARQISLTGTPFKDSLTPPDLTPAEKINLAKGFVEGGVEKIGGFDLNNIDDRINDAAKTKLQETTGKESGFSFQDAIDADLRAGHFRAQDHGILESIGLMTFSGAGQTRVGRLNQSTLTSITEGLIPEFKGFRESLKAQALSSINSATDPEAFLNDPFIKASLKGNSQGLRSAFAARGLSGSGAAALMETTQGLTLLESLRKQRLGEGQALANAVFEYEAGGDLGQFGLSLQDVAFNRQAAENFGNQNLEFFMKKIEDIERDKDVASSPSTTFKHQFAGSLGAGLGEMLTPSLSDVKGLVLGG